MNDLDLEKLQATKTRLISGMLDYVRAGEDDFDCGYSEADVQKCDKILRAFTEDLQKLGPAATESQILECVKKAILALNKLNQDAGGRLIETDQREDIFEYVSFAARQCGLKTEGDVTEARREW